MELTGNYQVMTEDEPHLDPSELPLNTSVHVPNSYSLKDVNDMAFIDASFPLNIGEDVLDAAALKHKILNGTPSKPEATVFVEAYFGRTPMRFVYTLKGWTLLTSF
jgi:hypothetical protein